MATTIGIERERFIVSRKRKKIVPAIGALLPLVWEIAAKEKLPANLFGYELFAGQIEDRTPPCESLSMIEKTLRINDDIINRAGMNNGLEFDFSEFVEEQQITRLEVNPFDQRHKGIWQSISAERRSAASRVAAIHVHLAVAEEQAVALLNFCRKKVITPLIKAGDHSNGRRIATYRIMSQSEGTPPLFRGFEELLAYIDSKGGERNVWDLVRYKPSTKTVEFRMFGATADIKEIIKYVELCLNIFDSVVA